MKRLEVETMIDISHSVWTPRRQGRPLLMVQFATFLNWKQEGRPPTQRRGLMAQQTPAKGGGNHHLSGWLVSFRNRSSFIVHRAGFMIRRQKGMKESS